MDLPTALLRDLLDLSASVDGDAELGSQLSALTTALSTAVSSYGGLDLTMHGPVHPVSLTSFLPTTEGAEIVTSLRLPFAALSSGFDARSRVIFYATTPGAFVDLAADLGHVLRAPTVLDADLPPRTAVSQLSGVHEMSTINRAVGMLIEQGHHPDDAHSVLRRNAAAAGVETHVYAAQLLRR